ncbi:MAG: hypothetical protein WC628_00695 [Candidatus Omnitrophota bacterium]
MIDKNLLKNILLVLLLTLTAVSIVKYIYTVREKLDLSNNLNQANSLSAALENEKQNLLQELEKEKQLQGELVQKKNALKDYLRASKTRLFKLFLAYQKSQAELTHADFKFSILKQENIILRGQRFKFKQESELLKSKLISPQELKKTIQELKAKKRSLIVEPQKISPIAEPQKIFPEGKTVSSNTGFLVKEGKAYLPIRIKIEVIPAPIRE